MLLGICRLDIYIHAKNRDIWKMMCYRELKKKKNRN